MSLQKVLRLAEPLGSQKGCAGRSPGPKNVQGGRNFPLFTPSLLHCNLLLRELCGMQTEGSFPSSPLTIHYRDSDRKHEGSTKHPCPKLLKRSLLIKTHTMIAGPSVPAFPALFNAAIPTELIVLLAPGPCSSPEPGLHAAAGVIKSDWCCRSEGTRLRARRFIKERRFPCSQGHAGDAAGDKRRL